MPFKKLDYSLVLKTVCVTTALVATGLSPSVSSETPLKSSDDLRGSYYGTGSVQAIGNTVGRLAIELIANDQTETVRVDHPFHNGDTFRFTVSTNRDGWLYILHKYEGEKSLLLWPRLANGDENTYLDDNLIPAGHKFVVPPSPGLFIFDEETGNEHFYAIISNEKQVPEIVDSASEQIESSSSSTPERKNQIVNFAIRSETSAQPVRGVIFDPGQQDNDPFLYFSAAPDGGGETAIVEFQLKHEE